MRKLTAGEIKETNLLKHYRIIRRWACRNNDLTDADLELLIYLECLEYFTRHDFKMGVYSYSWDCQRWNRLLKKVGLPYGEKEIIQHKNTIYTKYL